jgi:hypothetical protein
VKPIRRAAAPVLAALALAGFLSWSGLGVGGSNVARAAGGNVGSGADAGAAFSADRVEQGARQQLTTGCNQIAETGLPVGGKVGDWVTQNVQPSNTTIAVWHFDNASQHYKAAYFQDPAVPVDIPTFTTAIDAFFICVNATATAP